MNKGKNGITSYEQFMLSHSYCMTTGVIGHSDTNAPFLKSSSEVPFEVVPSAKTTMGGYIPSLLIVLYLSPISVMICSLISYVAPLAIKIHPRAWQRSPNTGMFLSSFLAANAG